MRFLKLRAAALCCAVALTAGACAGGARGADGPSVQQGGTVTFASWQWLEPGRGQLIWDAVSGYRQEHPQVRLAQRQITRAAYESSISTQIGGGQGPDILIIPDTYYPDLAEAGVLEPLDGVLAPADEARLQPAGRALVSGGHRLALVWELVDFAFFWNKKLLAEAGVTPPKTPDELVTAARQVKQRTGVTGYAARHQMNEQNVWWLDFANWPYGFGGGWSDGGRLTIDSPANVKAVTAFKKMYDSGAFAIGDDASTFRAKFGQGQIGMMIDNGSALYSMVGSGKGALTSKDIGVSALPFTARSSAAADFYIGINANSKHKKLAKDVLRWMFTKGAQQRLAAGLAPSIVGTGEPTPRKFIDVHPWVPAFQSQRTSSRVSVIKGFETETPRIRTIVLTQIERVLTENLDPAEALRTAQNAAEEAVG